MHDLFLFGFFVASACLSIARDPVSQKSSCFFEGFVFTCDFFQNNVINASVNNGSTSEERHCMVQVTDDHCDPNELKAIVVDCSSFPYMDLMGVDALKQIYEEYKEVGVVVMFASVKG